TRHLKLAASGCAASVSRAPSRNSTFTPLSTGAFVVVTSVSLRDRLTQPVRPTIPQTRRVRSRLNGYGEDVVPVSGSWRPGDDPGERVFTELFAARALDL